MPGYSAAQTQPSKIMYRVEEAADLMALSRTAVYALIRSGNLETIKIGNRRRIPRRSIEDYVSRQLAAAEGLS